MGAVSVVERGTKGWLERFVLPLVSGGAVRVGPPIDAPGLQALRAGSPAAAEVLGRIAVARRAVAAEVVVEPTTPELGEEAFRLCGAVHDLLFLSHPEAIGWARRPPRLRVVAAFAERLAALDPPRGAQALIDRHTLVHRLFQLERQDVRVSFWAGSRVFRGMQPPARWYRWSRARRVREERWRSLVLAEVAVDPLRRPILDALLAASPLTALWQPDRSAPRFSLAGVADHLRDPRVARALVNRYLQLGLARVGAPLTEALGALCDGGEGPQQVRLATELLCHLHLLQVMRGVVGSWLDELRPMVLAESAMKDFCGIFAAALKLGVLRPLESPGGGFPDEAVREYAAACAAVCGERRLQELVGLLGRGLGQVHLVG